MSNYADSRSDAERARDAAMPPPTVTTDAPEGGPWYVEVDPRKTIEMTYGVRRLATPPPPETRAMTRWTFDNPRATIEQSTGHSRLHRVPGAVEAVLAETLPGAQCSARWWYPTVMGTPGVPSGDHSVYGRITVTVPAGVDCEALCLRLTAAVRNATEGPAPDIEVVC